MRLRSVSLSSGFLVRPADILSDQCRFICPVPNDVDCLRLSFRQNEHEFGTLPITDAPLWKRHSISLVNHRVVKTKSDFQKPQRLPETLPRLASVNGLVSDDPNYNASRFRDAKQLGSHGREIKREPVVISQRAIGGTSDCQINTAIGKGLHSLHAIAALNDAGLHLIGECGGVVFMYKCTSSSRDGSFLLAPHHGSRKANPKALANWARPKHVVVSAGPRVDFKSLRAAYGDTPDIVSTYQAGAVTFEIRPDGTLLRSTVRPDREGDSGPFQGPKTEVTQIGRSAPRRRTDGDSVTSPIVLNFEDLKENEAPTRVPRPSKVGGGDSSKFVSTRSEELDISRRPLLSGR